MYRKYLVRPIFRGFDQDKPSIIQDIGSSDWSSQNFKIEQNNPQKRNGYYEDRDFGAGVDVQNIIYYQNSAGSTYTVILTDTDAIKREPDGTWSYITEAYTTEEIDSITGTAVTGDTTGWATGTNNPATDDYFVMDADLDADAEPDSYWTKIASVTNDTAIVLSNTYEGTLTGGDYTVRQVYTVPDNERWTWAVVKDVLYFTNGSTNLQAWSGTGNAAEVDATYAKYPRYCLEYADRLLIADLYSGSDRKPYRVQWSKNNDPTDWTDSTAGSVDLMDTEDIITGLAKVGANLVVFKSDSIMFGNRTGSSTAPIQFVRQRPGIGTPAPYSIVHFEGTCAFIGRNDFYIVDGETPVSIGKDMRNRFFDLVNPTELKRAFGGVNTLEKQIRWFVTDVNNTRRVFVYNWKYQTWTQNVYAHDMSCNGKGEVA